MSDALFKLASDAMAKAYAPYSNYSVGCALKADSGQYYSGCNIENASYGLTCCAEATAISHFIMADEQQITEAAVVADHDTICVPCGMCRQRLREFAKLDAKIYCYNRQGDCKEMTLEQLLPNSFGPENME